MTFSQTATAIMILGLPRSSKSIAHKKKQTNSFLLQFSPTPKPKVSVPCPRASLGFSTVAFHRSLSETPLACRPSGSASFYCDLPLNSVVSMSTAGSKPSEKVFGFCCALGTDGKAGSVQRKGKKPILAFYGKHYFIFKKTDTEAF